MRTMEIIQISRKGTHMNNIEKSTIHDLSGLSEILNEVLSMNKMVKIVDQHFIDFLSVNQFQLCHYIVNYFNFNHLHSTFPAALYLQLFTV
jgi:hypothetical protein